MYMKKNILSFGIIILFGTYVLFVRFQDISKSLFGGSYPTTGLINKNTKTIVSVTNSPVDLTSTEPNVAPTNAPRKVQKTICVYIPTPYGGEDDDEEGGGHYKCTTTTVDQVTKPATPTTSPTINNTSMMGRPRTMGSPMMNRIWNDGTYTGDLVDAYYGNVQVSATISGDKITNIAFLDYPQDRSTSLQKSNYAMPILKREAISAQSANVDTVSGVTYTSEAFIKSLSSALAQAKI